MSDLLSMVGLAGPGSGSDEKYRRTLRRRGFYLLVLMVLGVVTIAVALLARFCWDVSVHERQISFYCGVGTGLTCGSLAVLLRIRRTLSDPELLRRKRIAAGDERLREIGRRAAIIACYVLLVALYLVGLIGGLFYPVLFQVLGLLAGIFLAAYWIAYSVLNKKM